MVIFTAMLKSEHSGEMYWRNKVPLPVAFFFWCVRTAALEKFLMLDNLRKRHYTDGLVLPVQEEQGRP